MFYYFVEWLEKVLMGIWDFYVKENYFLVWIDCEIDS